MIITFCEPTDDDRDNEKNSDDAHEIPYTHKHKIKMNRLFREKVGGSFLPFPEVDSPFERLRSRLVIRAERIKKFLRKK